MILSDKIVLKGFSGNLTLASVRCFFSITLMNWQKFNKKGNRNLDMMSDPLFYHFGRKSEEEKQHK